MITTANGINAVYRQITRFLADTVSAGEHAKGHVFTSADSKDFQKLNLSFQHNSVAIHRANAAGILLEQFNKHIDDTDKELEAWLPTVITALLTVVLSKCVEQGSDDGRTAVYAEICQIAMGKHYDYIV